MSVDMSYEERRRYEAYLESQDYFEGVSEQTAGQRLWNWLSNNVPRVFRALEAAYRLSKGAYDLFQILRGALGW